MTKVISADGTQIAYETQGSGPVVIVVNTVAEDRTSLAGIAGQLAANFTVISYDRRGRGESNDTLPYEPQREIEDLAAVIEAAGGRAALISGSAGCVLCLDTATALGDAVTALYLYEPPFIVDDARPPMPADYVARMDAFAAAGQRSEAVEYFMTAALQVPAEWVEGMKADPSWEEMARYAHTYAYDGRILTGLQDGKPLPRNRWNTTAPILAVVGANSEPYFHTAATALAEVLPKVDVATLPGQDHGAFWMAPEVIVDGAKEFFDKHRL